MRIRSIKPEFWSSESNGRLSRDARLLFVGMFCLADDHGRLRASPVFLASSLMPYDEDARRKVATWMKELADAGKIMVYDVEGDTYAEVRNFNKHQKIDQRYPSRIPAPPPVPADSHQSPPVPADFTPTEQGTGSKEQGAGKPPIPPKGGDADFEAFWKAYPKKVGKKDAAKSWEKAKDKPALAAVLAAISAQAAGEQWRRDGGQYIPNPATWLNQGRWADETATVKKAKGYICPKCGRTGTWFVGMTNECPKCEVRYADA